MDNRVILITGGTGSFGYKFTQTIFERYKPKKLIIFSRDEFKQHNMAKIFPESKYEIRYFLGDIRDRERLYRAFDGVDYIVHAAALKHVPALEYNPMEAVKTNVLGANNIVDAAVDCGVKKVVALSTDKAVNPINLYGATKLSAEKIFIAANAYSGGRVKFSAVRYGNVIGSRGSVIPLFMKLREGKYREFPITDERMTRFWITLQQAVELVIKAFNEGEGGEIFIPIIPSMKIVDLAAAIDPKCKLKIVGIRPGEKLHETLVSEDEARKTKICGNTYVILPQFIPNTTLMAKYDKYQNVQEGFEYRSDTNTQWLGVEELKKIVKEVAVE
jgi:UDP-N-acetylglucosamine 4,6-dehydratase (inverting)